MPKESKFDASSQDAKLGIIKRYEFAVPSKYPDKPGRSWGSERLKYKISKEEKNIEKKLIQQDPSLKGKIGFTNYGRTGGDMTKVYIVAYKNKERGTASSAQRKPAK